MEQVLSNIQVQSLMLKTVLAQGIGNQKTNPQLEGEKKKKINAPENCPTPTLPKKIMICPL